MPGQPKYCPECKGFGNLYVQSITRYGDTRTKSTSRILPHVCKECKGTGMITLQTTKTPQFKPEDIVGKDAITGDEADAIVEEAIEKESIEERAINIRAKEAIEERAEIEMEEKSEKIDEEINEILEAPKRGGDDMEFEPKFNEPPEGEMPL